jgi:acyl carrier protein
LPGPSSTAESWTRRGGFAAYDDSHDGYDTYDDGYDAYDPLGERGLDRDPDHTVAPEHVADVLETVRDMLVEVIGPEYLLDLSVELDTRFDEDLEIESLEFVALAERLLHHYGGQVDFVAWLATMELDEIIALTVGDLVTFIVASTRY